MMQFSLKAVRQLYRYTGIQLF